MYPPPWTDASRLGHFWIINSFHGVNKLVALLSPPSLRVTPFLSFFDDILGLEILCPLVSKCSLFSAVRDD